MPGLMQALKEHPLWQYYISAALVMAPMARVFLRAGFRPYPALLLLTPWLGHVLCFAYLALVRWPRLPAKGAKA